MTLARRVKALEQRSTPQGLRLVLGEYGGLPAVCWVRPGGPAIVALPHNGRDPLPRSIAHA